VTDAGQRSRPWDPAWRATLCVGCAAPFEVPVAGGRVSCPACGVAEELPARDLRPVRFEPRADGTPRRERLREQDGKPLLPPPEIASLSDGGVLPEWKAAEALAAWQGLRRELRANPADAGAGDRLAYLSLLMQNREAGVHDPRRKRARLESALEAVALPRHRQLFLARLSRAACRAEDFRSAEAWLALCDPRADDLFADSEWRLARAYLDAARRDWAAVLRTLGATCDELPVHDACDNFAGVLRAHALEQLGRRDEATTELARRLVQLQDRRVVARLVDELGWCRELHPVALARIERAAAADSASRSGNLEALVLAGTAGLLFVILAIWAAVHLLDHHGVLDLLDEPPGDPGTGAVLTTGLPFVPLIMVLGLLIAAWRSYRKGRQAHRLRLAGRLMEAEVLGTQETGTNVGGAAERDVRLRVRPPDGPPYEATTRLLLGGEHEEPLTVGATVFVRVDPDQPGRVLIVTNP
jgi:hypothetical protein